MKNNSLKLFCLSLIQLLSISTFHSQCLKSGEFQTNGLVTHTTTNVYIDSLIYSEIDKLESYFNLNIDFFFLEEANINPVAYFNVDCTENCMGSIVLGYNMIADQLVKTNGLETVKAILAHEFAHAVQNYYGWSEPGKNPELHADFIAGYYIGETYKYEEFELTQFYRTFASIGDDDFFSPSHHGTEEERLCAFYEGHYVSKNTEMSMKNALAFAYNYVSQYSPCGIQAAIKNQSIYEKDKKNNNTGSVVIKCKTFSPLIVDITDYDGRIKRYTVYKELTINQLAVNVNYPINIYEANTGRIRYQETVIPSINGSLLVTIKEGIGIVVKWPQPSR